MAGEGQPLRQKVCERRAFALDDDFRSVVAPAAVMMGATFAALVSACFSSLQ
jgi:hypothetical protein